MLKALENAFLAPIDLGLSRMERLMQALGKPQQKLPHVIHVAGTNGKGSLIAYLRAILSAAEKKTHIYTSPHLIRFNERIILAGQEVEDGLLLKALQKIYRLKDQFPGTLFELSTAAAFTLFAEHKADALLLEVGLGGRLDATNVVQTPAVTVITPVSLDHMEYLGETLPLIAAEKAGIMKPSVPCVVGPQEPEAMAMIEQKAQTLNVPLHRFGKEWTLENNQYHSATLDFILPDPSLIGEHQWLNAATAVAVMDVLHQQNLFSDVNADHLKLGIQSAVWPARLQSLNSPALLDHLPKDSKLWLDGGHNPAAGKMLAAWLKKTWGDKAEISLVCGMMQSKDATGFFKPLAPYVKQCFTVPIPREPKSFTAETLAEIAGSCAVNTIPATDVFAAFQQISQNPQPQNVLIAGSLYLSGVVLALTA